MFTGIVEEMGTIERMSIQGNSGSIAIRAKKVLEDAHIGDSIAVNGICLTVTSLGSDKFTADVMAETVRRSSLKSLGSGSQVNLERAMGANSRFGGHIVSGHIDGTGMIESISREENAIWFNIVPPPWMPYEIVEKGSITLDGISLTVAYVDERCFKVSVIPHTAAETILKFKSAGDAVNIETDIIAKYVAKLLGKEKKQETLTMDFLIENGF
ncbi:MAG: riboflavin synthase [Lachnospiraceae bacterium]|nr:riboflavin synthase [Lachnospiraceae bacterium]